MTTNEMCTPRKDGESKTDLAKVLAGTPYVWAVSYTHLDVYKRQLVN